MLYRNKITGAVVEVKSEITGGGWEPAEVSAPEKEKKTADAGKNTKGKKRG